MKANKVYYIPGVYQLAKRIDGEWFYREWKNLGYGPTWTRWQYYGRLIKVEMDKENITLSEFAGCEKVFVKKVYATFSRHFILRIQPRFKTYRNTVRLPDEKFS